jgi:hypothetical protein
MFVSRQLHPTSFSHGNVIALESIVLCCIGRSICVVKDQCGNRARASIIYRGLSQIRTNPERLLWRFSRQALAKLDDDGER